MLAKGSLYPITLPGWRCLSSCEPSLRSPPSFEQVMQTLTLPDWYYAVDLISPSEAYQFFGTIAFNVSDFNGMAVTVPSFVTLPVLALDLLVWAAVPYVLAVLRFNRIDL